MAHTTFWTHAPHPLSHVLLKQAYMGKQEESEDRWRVDPFVVSDFLQVCGEMKLKTEVQDRMSLLLAGLGQEIVFYLLSALGSP